MGRRGTCIGYRWERKRERHQYEDQDVGGWIILRWILERQDEVVWTGLVWLGIETRAELRAGSIKMLGNCRAATQLVASRVVISSIELVRLSARKVTIFYLDHNGAGLGRLSSTGRS
jgi:hypothetical protein